MIDLCDLITRIFCSQKKKWLEPFRYDMIIFVLYGNLWKTENMITAILN